MKIEELYIQSAKNAKPRPAREITLLKNRGADGDYRHGGERQISLWDSRAKEEVKALGYPGLCMGRFSANIILSGFADVPPASGDFIHIAGTTIKVTQSGKMCFPGDCGFAARTSDCPVRRCAYGIVKKGGVIRIGDEALSISRNEGRD